MNAVTTTQQPFNRIARYYDAINDLLTLGRHRKWKKQLVSEVLRNRCEGDVVDLATGTGDLALLFANHKRCEGKIIIGIDPSPEMIAIARRRVARQYSVAWKLGSSEQLPLENNSVAVLTCAFGVRNFTDRKRAFQEWARVVKPGGKVGVLEIHPLEENKSYLRWTWNQVMPRVAGWFADPAAYHYLRDTVNEFLSQKALSAELESNGFKTEVCEKRGPGGMVGFSIFSRV